MAETAPLTQEFLGQMLGVRRTTPIPLTIFSRRPVHHAPCGAPSLMAMA
jgi:hypothetical protein